MANDVYYLTIGQIQTELNEHYERYGEMILQEDAEETLRVRRRHQERLNNAKLLPQMYHLDFDEFPDRLMDVQVECTGSKLQHMKEDISYSDIDGVDVFLHPSYHHGRCEDHIHQITLLWLPCISTFRRLALLF